jgi:hypothetical protein
MNDTFHSDILLRLSTSTDLIVTYRKVEIPPMEVKEDSVI